MNLQAMLNLITSFLLFLLMGFASPVFGQTDSSGMAVPISISGQGVKDGSLICTDKKENVYVLCSTPYDSSMVGVITDKPSVSIDIEDMENRRFLMTSGRSLAKVAAINGNIKAGDPITSSEIKGVGQKADKDGFVLGVALEDFEASNPNSMGRILVDINLHPMTGVEGDGRSLAGMIFIIAMMAAGLGIAYLILIL
jgi:hypothetical protein